MDKVFRGLMFFIGWVLSPFTWWNDAFINIPLSYIIANLLFYIIKIKFAWLVISSYWLTNALGLFFMYFGGKSFIASTRNKVKTVALMAIFLTIYSALMFYLDRHGKLAPLCIFFDKYCTNRY